MARRTVLVCDLSGEEIPDGSGATVTITFRDARKGVIVFDVTDLEAERLGANGKRQRRRGRQPSVATDTKGKKGGGEVSSGQKPIEGVGTSIAA
jgi:hypothetical protein